MSNTISAHAAAVPSNQCTAPYPLLPGWWSMLIDVDRSRPVEAGAGQVAALHHDDRVGRRPARSRRSRSRPTPGNSCQRHRRAVAHDHAGVLAEGPQRQASASADPMASPSGRTCDVMTMCWWRRRSSQTRRQPPRIRSSWDSSSLSGAVAGASASGPARGATPLPRGSPGSSARSARAARRTGRSGTPVRARAAGAGARPAAGAGTAATRVSAFAVSLRAASVAIVV